MFWTQTKTPDPLRVTIAVVVGVQSMAVTARFELVPSSLTGKYPCLLDDVTKIDPAPQFRKGQSKLRNELFIELLVDEEQMDGWLYC